MQLDSTEISYLLELAYEYNDWVGIKIKNLLCFGYDICIEDQITSTESRLGVKETDRNDKSSDRVKVYPNPGNSYIVFDISLSGIEVPAMILISDLTGKILTEIPITEPLSQKLFDIRNLPNAVYEYLIQNNGTVIQSGKITVNH